MLETDRPVYIVGPRRLHNEIMVECLKRETGAECCIEENICRARSRENGHGNGKPRLILWDCEGKDSPAILGELKACGNHVSPNDYVALFNVSPERGIEQRCVWQGIRGFFYGQDSWPQFLKGVDAVSSGQLWLSRDIMTECILDQRGRPEVDETESALLSQREQEILAQLAVGASNDDIADVLCISPHTVKSHLYNIYKKINVPSRLEAVLWASKHL